MLTKVTGISLVIFPAIEIKYLDKKNNIRENGFTMAHNLSVCHIRSSVRKPRMTNLCAQLASFLIFMQYRTQGQVKVSLSIRGDILTSTNLVRMISPKHA